MKEKTARGSIDSSRSRFVVVLAVLAFSLTACDASRSDTSESADDDATPVTTAPAEEGCGRRDTVRADVDGDGAVDRVFHAWIRDRAVLGVCTAAGDTDRMPGAGQAELLQIVEVEGDEGDEILYGSTTAAAQLFEVAVYSDGDLSRVRTTGSDALVLVDGADPGALTESTPAGGAIGCSDLDGDGAAVIVQVTVTARGERALQWSLIGYEIEQGVATAVAEGSGSRRNDPGERDVREVVELAQTLTTECTT